MLPIGYQFCGACGSRQGSPGRCRFCQADETTGRPLAPRIWPCSGCQRPIWEAELCEVCGTAQCPLCLSEQQGQRFGLGCGRCGFQPYGTMEQAAEAWALGAGSWPVAPTFERRPGD